MTEIQRYTQCEGPAQPSTNELVDMLLEIPKHHKIVAVSIKGQGGEVVIETRHEDMDQIFRFATPSEKLPV